MSNIGGKKREQSSESGNLDFVKKVGLFEAKVVAVNPTLEEYKDILNISLKEDSKVTNYLSTSKNGNDSVRIDFWLEEVKTQEKFRLSFLLENKEKVSNDGNKQQYINAVGKTSWAADPNDLYDWFSAREYRVAFVGEEDLYNFLRSWLGNLDLRDAESTLQLDFKRLLKGNVKDLKDLLNSEWVTNVVALATVKIVTKQDEDKAYQAVYNKAFLAPYNMKFFRTTDYTNPRVLGTLKTKAKKECKPYEMFVKNIIDSEYGCKDFYVLKDLREYNPSDNIVESNSVIADDDTTY